MKKILSVVFAAMLVLSLTTVAFASSTPVTATELQSVITAVTGQISVTTILSVLVAAIGAAIGFVFMWWGVRKLMSTFFAGFRKGKASV